MKLGKTPARSKAKDITLDSVATTLSPAPVGFGHYDAVGQHFLSWGMLGNDQWGDCVWAGADHETMMINAMNNRVVQFTAANALSDYSAVTGFNPKNPNSDQGTDVHQALDYRRATGVVDAAGTRHKIGAYVALEPGNWQQMLEALRAFDFVGIGFEFPDYAMDEFNQGKPWSFQKGGTIEGGHYVPIVGRPHSWTIDVVTWGTVQAMGRRFFEAYADEVYGVLSLETLSAGGVTPEGLNLDALNAALAKL